MKKIVLVGKPGSGKSTVLKELKKQGFITLSGDKIVNALYLKGAPGYNLIKENLGSNFVNKVDVNRLKLIKFINENEENKLNLNRLIHPLINNYIHNANYDVLELPIIGSGKFDFKYDLIIEIDTSDEVAIERLREQRNLNEKKASNYISLYNRPTNVDLVIEGTKSIDKILNEIIKKMKS